MRAAQFKIQIFWAVLCVLALVSLFMERSEKAPKSAAEQRGAYYILALSWQAAFCETRPRAPECQSLDDFARQEFVLHGLWPNGRDLVYCDVDAKSRSAAESRRWCDLPPLDLQAQLAQRLTGVMPAKASCLDRYEWVKHGSCSGLSVTEYYARSSAFVERFAKTAVSDLVAAHRGQRLNKKQFYQAVARDFGQDGSWKVQAICRGGELREIRLAVALAAHSEDRFEQWLEDSDLRMPARCPAVFWVSK